MSNPNEVNVRISVETSEEKSCMDECCESKPSVFNYVVTTTYGQFLVEEVSQLITAECTTLLAIDGHILASFDSDDVLFILDADKVSEIYDDPCEDCEGPCCCEVGEDSCEDSSENN